MLKACIDKILSLKTPEPITLRDRLYTTEQVYPVRDPEIPALSVSSLTGLISYLNEGLDKDTIWDIRGAGLFIHVDSYREISLRTELHGDFDSRACLLRAKAYQNQFEFNQYLDLEEFIIGLQASFVMNDNLEEVIATVGTLVAEAGVGLNDDGMTQEVTTRRGIARKGTESVKNPIKLRPFVTFPEIDQPELNFVLRLKQGDNGRVAAALFDTADVTWQNTTARIIAAHLEAKLNTKTPILL